MSDPDLSPLSDAELAKLCDITRNGPTAVRMARELVERRKDGERLELASEFDLGAVGRGANFHLIVCIRRCFGHRLPKEPMWKVIDESGAVLCKDGEWEFEPQPSSRDEEYYAMARYDTFEDARAAIDAARELAE